MNHHVTVYRALPTWVLTNLVSPFLPAGHPWRGRWFPLREWHARQTPLAVSFDYTLGLCVLSLFASACWVFFYGW